MDRLFITLSVTEPPAQSKADVKEILKKSAEKLGDYMQASGRFSFVMAKLPRGYEISLFSTFRKALPYPVEPRKFTLTTR